MKQLSVFQELWLAFFRAKFKREWSLVWKQDGTEKGSTYYVLEITANSFLLHPYKIIRKYPWKEYKTIPVVLYRSVQNEDLQNLLNEHHMTPDNYTAQKLVKALIPEKKKQRKKKT